MQERRKDRSETREIAVIKQLEHIAREGGFRSLVVATENGLKVGDAGSGYSTEELAALGGMLVELKELVQHHSPLRDIAENRLILKDGTTLVCRFFEHPVIGLALLAVCPDKDVREDLIDRTVTGVTRILSTDTIDQSKSA